MKKILIPLLFVGSLFGQTIIGPLTIASPAPPPINIASTNVVSNVGPGLMGQQSYYWIVANYIAGKVPPRGPLYVTGIPYTLNASNYVQLNWMVPIGASSVDILKTSTPNLPSNGSCTCALVTAQTGSTYKDVGGSLTAYSITSLASPASASIALDNINYATPTLTQTITYNGITTTSQIGSGSGSASQVQSGTGVNVSSSGTNPVIYTPSLDVAYATTQVDAQNNNFTGNNNFGIGTGELDATAANDVTTGTGVNQLALLSSTGAILPGITATTGVIGICYNGCGKTGNARIATAGEFGCAFDSSAAVSKGDYVQISATTSGDCKDAGATKPASGEIVGIAMSSGAASTTQTVWIHIQF